MVRKSLRFVGSCLAAVQALPVIQQGIKDIMTGINDLKAADAAEASATAAALAEIKTLSEQHQADLAQLAAQTSDGTDVAPLVASMQSRAKSLTDAIAAVQAQVAPPAAAAGTDTVSGAATADTVSGAASTDTVSGAAGTDGSNAV